MMFPKPEPRARQKRRQKRLESVRARSVRAAVSLRDGQCRAAALDGIVPCQGRSTWHHVVKRSKTRGMLPEKRHDTKTSCMLCVRHHEDAERGRLRLDLLTARGADGPMQLSFYGRNRMVTVSFMEDRKQESFQRALVSRSAH